MNLSGAASLAPSAAPKPQPSPPAGPSAKNVPGFSRAQWSGRSGYSLMMTASLPTVSPMTRDRYSGEIVVPGGGILRQLRAPRPHALGQPRAARGNARVRHLQARLDRAHKRIQRLCGAGLHREIAREAAHRIAHVERVFADMRDAAAAGRMLQMRDPRHVGFKRDHQIGIGEQRAGLEAEMHRMARRQAHRARVVRDDRDGAAFGQALELRDRLGGQGRR